jgi:monofunctional chorismate mutase
MSTELQLDHLRGVLVRLEETIIFGLIERSQFRRNERAYERGAMGGALNGESLLEYVLHEAERSHAKVRRYTSPDEYPFFDDLPAPMRFLARFTTSPRREWSIANIGVTIPANSGSTSHQFQGTGVGSISYLNPLTRSKVR